MTSPHDSLGGYEKSDLKAKPIFAFGLILVLVTLLVMATTYGMIRVLGWWERPRLETPASPLATRTIPAEPRLQVDAPKNLKTLLAEEEILLGSYAWVSREAGIARIPIDRAMTLLLERGLPIPPQPVPPAKPTARGGPR
jgi:hypothetical protein